VKRLRSFQEIMDAEARATAPSGKPLTPEQEALKAAVLAKLGLAPTPKDGES
jgi:hypothetical protein